VAACWPLLVHLGAVVSGPIDVPTECAAPGGKAVDERLDIQLSKSAGEGVSLRGPSTYFYCRRRVPRGRVAEGCELGLKSLCRMELRIISWGCD
jgi:hypothetical protein